MLETLLSLDAGENFFMAFCVHEACQAVPADEASTHALPMLGIAPREVGGHADIRLRRPPPARAAPNCAAIPTRSGPDLISCGAINIRRPS